MRDLRGMTQYVDAYLGDQWAYGRINSPRTEVAYRSHLLKHAEVVNNRPPNAVSRDDVKKTLRHWGHPNSQRKAHAVFASFYDWCMEEGIRKDNPARQIRRAKKRETTVYRLTRVEVIALMQTAMPVVRWRLAIFLCLLTGLRSRELRGLQGRHFARPGWVHVSAGIAKGNRERWVPVLGELEPIVAWVTEHVESEHYVLPRRQVIDPPFNIRFREDPTQPCSAKALWEMVGEIGKEAGIAAHLHPHLLRHAFGDHVAKYAGLRAAQALLGHVAVDTTASTYVDRPTLDEIAVSVHGFSFNDGPPAVVEGRGTPPATRDAIAAEATTGIEPVEPGFRSTVRDRSSIHSLARRQRMTDARLLSGRAARTDA